MSIIFNWIRIQSIILHSILFNYGSVDICETLNKKLINLGRVPRNLKLKTKWRPIEQLPWYSLQFLDLEARRMAKEASKARRRKIRRLKRQQWMRQFLLNQALLEYPPSAIPWLILSHSSFLLCMVFNSRCTASSIHKAIKSLASSNHHVSAILFNRAL